MFLLIVYYKKKNKDLPSDKVALGLCAFLSVFLNFLFGTLILSELNRFFPKIHSAEEVDIVGDVLPFKIVLGKALISTFLSRGD